MSDPSLLPVNQAIELIGTTTVQGVAFGINFTLYFLCAQLFYHRYRSATSSNERRKTILQFVCNSLMVILAGVELGVDAWHIQMTYINNGSANGVPKNSEPQELAATTVSTFEVLLSLPTAAIIIINFCWQVWRIRILWATSRYKLAITIFLAMIMVADIALWICSQVAKVPATLRTVTAVVLAAVVLEISSTIFFTLMLCGRIIAVRRRTVHLMGISSGPDHYTSIIAMLIESFAIDALNAIAMLISYGIFMGGNPITIYLLFYNLGDQAAVMAFLLVTYRVLRGRAWTPKTEKEISSLRWNHDAPRGPEHTLSEAMPMDPVTTVKFGSNSEAGVSPI